ncbi:MAG TPA: class I SAM-dependent methyltransferase [Steroidobacteraceae bacterium]|nr:class I SAM-dependent methyltransferase [Steroidobacteraceae bacterium]
MSGPDSRLNGAAYASSIQSNPSDVSYRRAFQSVALALVPVGGALFDFGCGPGIDARFYAEHGRRVAAFDVDPGMCEHFAHGCRDLMASGAVTLLCAGYREFLAGAAPAQPAPVTLVTANFAPLNLIDDLAELFARFALLTSATGAVLASVLSPYFAGDLRYRWWWRNAPRLLWHGRYAVAGAETLIWRRGLADFAAACAPHFALEEVFAGSTTRVHAARATWLKLTRCRYMFLLFRKPAGAARAV